MMKIKRCKMRCKDKVFRLFNSDINTVKRALQVVIDTKKDWKIDDYTKHKLMMMSKIEITSIGKKKSCRWINILWYRCIIF